MAVGTWTLAEKSDYISLLSSSTYSATAYILVVAGVVVMVTGILGCCATFKERRNLLRVVSFAPLFGVGDSPHFPLNCVFTAFPVLLPEQPAQPPTLSLSVWNVPAVPFWYLGCNECRVR